MLLPSGADWTGLILQVASELNAAILRMEDQEATSPRLADLLRLIMWAQEELDRKKVKYPKMVDLAEATIDKVDMSKWQMIFSLLDAFYHWALRGNLSETTI